MGGGVWAPGERASFCEKSRNDVGYVDRSFPARSAVRVSQATCMDPFLSSPQAPPEARKFWGFHCKFRILALPLPAPARANAQRRSAPTANARHRATCHAREGPRPRREADARAEAGAPPPRPCSILRPHPPSLLVQPWPAHVKDCAPRAGAGGRGSAACGALPRRVDRPSGLRRARAAAAASRVARPGRHWTAARTMHRQITHMHFQRTHDLARDASAMSEANTPAKAQTHEVCAPVRRAVSTFEQLCFVLIA